MSSFCRENIQQALFGSKLEKRFSVFGETPNKRSDKSFNSRFLLPGLIKYASNSMSAASPFIFNAFSGNLPPWTYFGILESEIQFPISLSSTLKASDALIATEYELRTPSITSNEIATGSLRPERISSSLDESTVVIFIFISLDSEPPT